MCRSNPDWPVQSDGVIGQTQLNASLYLVCVLIALEFDSVFPEPAHTQSDTNRRIPCRRMDGGCSDFPPSAARYGSPLSRVQSFLE